MRKSVYRIAMLCRNNYWDKCWDKRRDKNRDKKVPAKFLRTLRAMCFRPSQVYDVIYYLSITNKFYDRYITRGCNQVL